MIHFPTIWPFAYSGNGKLVDRGFLSKGDRFVLDLGVCDLARAGEYTIRLSRLPPKQLVIGVNLVSDEPLLVDSVFKPEVRVSTLVGLEVTNERGESVIAQRRRLDEWIWSHRGGSLNESFLWIDGVSVSRPVGNGVCLTSAVEFSADQGWGTCFRPRFFADYVARVTVDTPDPRAKTLQAMVRITGGGM